MPVESSDATDTARGAEAAGALEMPRAQMLDLARRVAEIVADRIGNLPGENAWEGEFWQVLEDQLAEEPPEEGRPAAEVIERAAREAAGHPERAILYMSDQSHGALARAAMIVDVRRENIRLVPSDTRFRMDMEALAATVAADRDAGLSPIAVAANAGATSTGAVDPPEALADFCAAERLWLHVDAVYGGFAVVTERGRRLLRGIEHADWISLDAHKWLFQPYEAGCLMVKDASTLEDPFGVQHDILQDTVWGRDHPNFSDLGLQLSRSFRALKVWMSIQTFGMAAFRRAVSQGMALAERAEEHVRASPVLEAVNTVSLGILCFRVNPADGGLDEDALEEVNRVVLARMFWDDRSFMSSTLLLGRSRSGCASSTIPPPGTTCARPWKRSNDSGGRRSRRACGKGRKREPSGLGGPPPPSRLPRIVGAQPGAIGPLRDVVRAHPLGHRGPRLRGQLHGGAAGRQGAARASRAAGGA